MVFLFLPGNGSKISNEPPGPQYENCNDFCLCLCLCKRSPVLSEGENGFGILAELQAPTHHCSICTSKNTGQQLIKVLQHSLASFPMGGL